MTGTEGGASGSLSHLDAEGRARMVDVGSKAVTERVAVAVGVVRSTADAVARAAAAGGKGDVIAVARLAGVMAAKRTADLIPLCHPLALSHVDVDVALDKGLPGVRIRAEVRCVGRTGVEMEALTAVTVAGLTVIDMLKAADHWCVLERVGLVSKAGGRSGDLVRPEDRPLDTGPGR